MDSWEEDIQKQTKTWIDEKKCLAVTVIGRTGTGKTSLVNGLLGKEVGNEGYTLGECTEKVTKFQEEIYGVQVTIWDTPGLQDGKYEDCLKKMIDSGCVEADLKIYCIPMTNNSCFEMEALSRLTTEFGVKFLDHCMFVLTFSNGYVSLCPIKTDKKEWLDKRIVQWRECMESVLRDVGVEERVIEHIQIVPAGYHKQLCHQDQVTPNCNPWELPGIENWFHPFWYTCADAMNPKALIPSFVKANRHQEITERDPEETIENVPSQQYLQHGVIAAGAGAVGLCACGAAGVGAAAVAVVGAIAVGGSVGVAGGVVLGIGAGAGAGAAVISRLVRYSKKRKCMVSGHGSPVPKKVAT